MIEEEIRVLVCIPSLIKPFPFNLLERTAKQCGRLVIAEEGTLQWGWGSELSARLHHSLFRELVVPILRIGAKDIAIPATRPLEEFVLPGEREIVRALLEVLQ
jgi:pyruvate dehydrogenase E1 component beta subunit